MTVNAAITVGEIDFGGAANFTITSSGGGALTLQNTAANSFLNVGSNIGSGTFVNSGLDLLTAPIIATTPLTATVGGGTLELYNTNATPNSFGSTSTFTLNPGGTLAGSPLQTLANQSLASTESSSMAAP